MRAYEKLTGLTVKGTSAYLEDVSRMMGAHLYHLVFSILEFGITRIHLENLILLLTVANSNVLVFHPCVSAVTLCFLWEGVTSQTWSGAGREQ